MTLLDAKEIVKKIRSLRLDEAAHFILDLANQGIIRDPDKDPSPLTPSGATPVYLKPNREKKRKKKPGRKKGHPGKSRKVPDHIDQYKEHALETCPFCQTPLKKPIKTRKRYIEDLPQIQPVVTEHIVHGYLVPLLQKACGAGGGRSHA